MSRLTQKYNGLKQKKLPLTGLLSVVMSPLVVTSTVQANEAQANLEVFNNAYDKIANVSVEQLAAPSEQQKQRIRNILNSAGITNPIESIEPSELPSMYQINLVQQPGLKSQPPLHITADGYYILQGELRANPSPKKSTPPQEPPSKTMSGMPVSDKLRASILQNSSLLKNITADLALYHTSVSGLIWGNAYDGQPFITTTDASVFTSGEISVIKNGQFAGLDPEFEQKKNLHVLSQLEEDQLITYPARSEEKAIIYVATDINCPYCRVMHQDMAKLNAKGITVKVIGYPYYEGSPEHMRQIWCETDNEARRQALDKAMAGEAIAKTCGSSKENYLIDNQITAAGLAVYATPAIYREDGVQFNAPYDDPSFLPFLGLQ